MKKNHSFDTDSEIIDVAYRTISDAEAMQAQQPRQTVQQPTDADEDALEELAREVMLDPERCFCRNCGQPIYKNASVCVHCNYVVNPVSLKTDRMFRKEDSVGNYISPQKTDRPL
jgi:hypothetical protein